MNSHESVYSGISSAYPASKHLTISYSQDMQNIISSWKTPLHIAASEGRCDELNLLLEHQQVDINLQTKRYNEYEGIIKLDNTPLHLAAQNCEFVLEMLPYCTTPFLRRNCLLVCILRTK